MTEPCKRHKADKSVDPDWRPVSNQARTRWAVAVIYRCVKCGDHLSPRVANHTIKPTQREALLAYGIPQVKVDEFFPPAVEAEPPKPKNYKPKPPVAVPLTSWPFPKDAR